jgi:diguanylate cyclase (GGDEF)-like protein
VDGTQTGGPEPARVALGLALRARADDVAAGVLVRAQRLVATYDATGVDLIRSDILRQCSLATLTVAHVLATGHPPTPEEWKSLASMGRAAAGESISLADMTKLFLYWRDIALVVLNEEASRCGADHSVLAEAEVIVRAGSDASLVRMAKEFDVRRRHLQAQLDEEQARLAYLATHDSLTGLPNRRTLFGHLADAIEATRWRPATSAVLFVDLNEFKAINDAGGHRAGDEVLIHVARRLEAAAGRGQIVARLGGDEFVVLCTSLRDPSCDAMAVADRIRAAFAGAIEVDGELHRVSASIGIALVTPGHDPERLLCEADAAMYMAKRQARPYALPAI